MASLLLMFAASGGHKGTTSILLDNKAEVNRPDRGGNLALMYAADKGNTEAVLLLLEHNSEIHFKNREGQTALDIANHKGYKKAAQILLEETITRLLSIRLMDKTRVIGNLFLKSPISKSYDFLEEYAQSKTLNKKLIERIINSLKKDVHLPDTYAPDAFEYIMVAEELNTLGAQKWVKSSIKKNDKFKEAAAKRLCVVSISEDKIDQVEFLIKAGAPLNEKSAIREFLEDLKAPLKVLIAPLMRAAQAGALKITHALIEAGADVTIVDDTGKSALDHAIENQNNRDCNQTNIKKIIHDLIPPTYLPLFRDPQLYFSLFPRDMQSELMEFYESAK